MTMSTRSIYVLSLLVLAGVAMVLYWMIADARVALAATVGVGFSVTAAAAFLMLRVERTRQDSSRLSPAMTLGQVAAAALQPVAKTNGGVSFRVVGARGECTLGHRIGELINIGSDGSCSPGLCSAAEATLKMAAKAGKTPESQRWCCPVYDHLLVFKRLA